MNPIMREQRGVRQDAGACAAGHRAAALRVTASCVLALALAMPAAAGPEETIARVKPSVVMIGTLIKTRNPPFSFRGTGFAVGDGRLIATNAHVVNAPLDAAAGEMLVVGIPGTQGRAELREAKVAADDASRDLALLRIDGTPLPPLALAEREAREGQTLLFTGFPIGSVLGPIPSTHRAMIASMPPIALPNVRAAQLTGAQIRRLAEGPFPVYQLDATAYPGNSGSPLYDMESGAVAGVINMVFVKRSREAALTQPSGITYAIPASHLRTLMEGAAK
jgi:S1-C subfamily serine protease